MYRVATYTVYNIYGRGGVRGYSSPDLGIGWVGGRGGGGGL